MFPLSLPSPWKLATIISGFISLGMVALLATTYMENRHLVSQNLQMDQKINDPKTGFVTRLAQANTNIEQLKVSIDRQNQAYASLQAESAARLRETERRLVMAQSQTRAVEARLNHFLATGPQGTTLQERVEDIDARILTELRQ